MNHVKNVLHLLLVDIVWSSIYFPLWWYTKGTRHIVSIIIHQAEALVRTLNLPTLARFLLTPMYGLTDVVSRIISFCVRLVHFSILSTLACLYIIGLLILLVFWLVLPLVILYNLAYQLQLLS